ncbi:hypothetical protein DERP_011360 [Dermatophagoides pteronyssinus]|uniref:Uncharacterized protein n=1 Tax=Dermatophagoides pteronyssinus TaxID=6956 RepID=A0ABQ8J7F1_DERPT|nr:hypothetical protein DERP_011360 [Dermatophagoides pteronyssinus]
MSRCEQENRKTKINPCLLLLFISISFLYLFMTMKFLATLDRIIRCSSQRLVDLLNDERKKFLLFARFAQHDTLLDARF